MGCTVYFEKEVYINLETIAESSKRIADALEEQVQLQKAEYVALKNKLNTCQEDEEK